LQVICNTSKLSLLRISTWALSNLCDGQPSQMFDVATVLPTLVKVLQRDDTEVLSHACWALSHLCDGPSPHVQAVVNVNVCKRLVNLLKYRSWRVVKPALRTIGNIVCAEDDLDYTQHIVEHGAVPCLRNLINHVNREIQKEACWTLSNIAAGTVEQIQFVLDSGSIPDLVQLAQDADTDPDVKIEACWVLLNATSCGNNSQIEYLVNNGCVSVLCALLSDASMIMMALEGLEKILQVGEFVAARSEKPIANPHAVLVDTAKVEQLQRHHSSAITKRAARMWKQHYVTCAICSLSFSKRSPETKWCPECKCSVCKTCDCSVYHLSYQESLWADIDASEAAEKDGSSKSNKRSKRAKKRAKEKLRREQEREKKEREEQEAKEKKEKKEKSQEKVNKVKKSRGSSIDQDVKSANNPPFISKKELDLEKTENHFDAVDFLQSTGSILELAAMFDKMDSMEKKNDNRDTGLVQ